MKPLLQVLIVALCIWGVIHLDILLYEFLASLIPNGDWKSLIKVIIIIVMIIYTTGIALILMFVASMIALFILELFMPKRTPYNTWNQSTRKRSKFQEKLENMTKKK